MNTLARLARWFGVDADWEHVPEDPRRAYRNDLVVGACIVVLTVAATELGRSAGMFAMGDKPDTPEWLPHLLAGVTAVPLAWRRRFPIATMLAVYALFLGTGLFNGAVTQVATLQVTYFMALYSGVAWARDRRGMLIAVGVVLLTMFGWIAVQLSDAAVRDEFLAELGGESPGLMPPWVALTLYQLLVNVAYFGGAIVLGQLSWHGAARRRQVAEQTATIERQAQELRDHAVLEERLRIARELHDVVAHHVSVIGVQAAAARRVLTKNPAKATEALSVIERSSREGVEQMRGLVGTLRQVDGTRPGDTAPVDSASTANLAGIAGLAEDATDGLTCSYWLVEEPPGASASVPGPIGAALYRTTQEALNNVRKHSTARGASVTLRVDGRGDSAMAHGWAEVEVLDDGHPLPGTSGSGLGLVGIRERAAAHDGKVEAGPRATVGFRVRVRLPLPDGGPLGEHSEDLGRAGQPEHADAGRSGAVSAGRTRRAGRAVPSAVQAEEGPTVEAEGGRP
ncbi:sensor histidine kinase [Myceligenerans pegani]|uniref:sensor histidine kinase n=1 Tax=Myceligenerans pegani TaxID=2776917 RepID=UPI00299D3263|nr:sensor histidine kinase [Myceligenerans sp. TRM 65318]